jgi:hypothetical protein
VAVNNFSGVGVVIAILSAQKNRTQGVCQPAAVLTCKTCNKFQRLQLKNNANNIQEQDMQLKTQQERTQCTNSNTQVH